MAASRRMGRNTPNDMTSRSRGVIRPGDASFSLPRKHEGAGSTGRSTAPAGPVGNKKNAHKSSGEADIARHSLRNGFTACSALSLASGLFSHHRRANRFARLDPSVGGSGPHGLAVRIVPLVLRHHASTATRLTSGDVGRTSIVARRDGFYISLFLYFGRDIFLRGALDSSGKTPFRFSKVPRPP